jgi:hypothetical protein
VPSQLGGRLQGGGPERFYRLFLKVELHYWSHFIGKALVSGYTECKVAWNMSSSFVFKGERRVVQLASILYHTKESRSWAAIESIHCISREDQPQKYFANSQLSTLKRLFHSIPKSSWYFHVVSINVSMRKIKVWKSLKTS